MVRWNTVAFAAMLLGSVVVSGCGGSGGEAPASDEAVLAPEQADPGKPSAKDARQFEKTLQAKFDLWPEAMPANARTQVEESIRSFQTELEKEFLNASALQGMEREQAFFNLMYRYQAEIKKQESNLESSQPSIDQYFSNASSAEVSIDSYTRHFRIVAEASSKIELLQAYYDRASKTGPMVQEVAKRLAAFSGDSRRRLEFLGRQFTEVRSSPCSYLQPQGAKSSPTSIRGIEMGMGRDQSLSALCETQGKQADGVRIRSEHVHKLFVREAWGLRTSRDLYAMKAFRKGLGTFDALVTEANAAMEGSTQAAITGRSMSSPIPNENPVLDICLTCSQGFEAPQDDKLEVRYSPDGKVWFIDRAQRFMVPVEQNGRILNQPAPQPYASISAAYEKQYGAPSFRFFSGSKVLLGWVYPDGKQPLPLEDWRDYRVAAPDGTGTRYVNRVLLNDAIVPGTTLAEAHTMLRATDPRATFCIDDSNLLTGDRFSTPARAAFIYGGAHRSTPHEQPKIGGKNVTALPYEEERDFPGYRASCGIVALAEFTLATPPGGRLGLPHEDTEGRIPADAQVASLQFTMKNLDWERDTQVNYVEEVVGRVREVNKNLQDAADTATVDFTP